MLCIFYRIFPDYRFCFNRMFRYFISLSHAYLQITFFSIIVIINECFKVFTLFIKISPDFLVILLEYRHPRLFEPSLSFYSIFTIFRH